MKITHAAVFEPNSAQHKRIALALKKAGLKVTPARESAALSKEQLVVLGPGIKNAAKIAREVRERLGSALLFAGQSKGFRAPFADGVLPLPVSPNDLRVRLSELSEITLVQPGEGITDPLTSFYTFTHFKEVLFVEVKRARRYGFPLSIALVGFDALEPAVGGELRSQLMGGLAL